MATLAFQPITDKQRISGGQLAFKKHGTNKYINFGAVVSMEMTPNLAPIESYTSEFGDRRLIGEWTVTKDANINIVCESWTDLAFEALYMSEKKYITQAAETAKTVTIDDVAIGDAIRLNGIRPTVTAVTNGTTGTPVTLVENEHYTVHKSGIVQIIALPANFGDEAIVKYSLPKVDVADGLLDMGIMSNNGIRGELLFIGVTGEGMPGQELEQIYWDVKLSPSGAIPSLNTEALNQFTLEGRVYASSGKGDGKAYGQVRSIT